MHSDRFNISFVHVTISLLLISIYVLDKLRLVTTIFYKIVYILLYKIDGNKR